MQAERILDALNMLRRGHDLCEVLLQGQSEMLPGETELPAVVAEGEKQGVWAHRAILAATSPYFRAMFESMQDEPSAVVVTMQHVESESLEAVVDYIYSPMSLLLTDDNAKSVLATATLLGVRGARDAACTFMTDSLSVDNAVGIRASARRHDCAALSTAATSYIDNHLEDVMQADEFLALAPKALAGLLDGLYVSREELLLDAVLKWLQHSPQERQWDLYQLLRHVRLPLIPHEILSERANTEPLVNAHTWARELLNEALTYHLKDPKDRALVAGNTWYRPRQPPLALLLMGGRANEATNDVVAYDLASECWKTAPAMPAARCLTGAALLDGRVYVVGGSDGNQRLNSVDIYEVATGIWTAGPSLSTVRCQLGVTTLEGRLYAVGGTSASNSVLSSAEVLDPHEGVWRPIASMSTGRKNVGVVAMGGMLYAVGGHNGKNALDSVERYDPSADRWETVEHMSKRRDGAGVSVVGNALYAVGGKDGNNIFRSVERYTNASWEPAPSMATPRSYGAITVHAGRLYVAGGRDDRNKLLDSVEVFDPVMSVWSDLPAPMPEGRTALAAAIVDWPPCFTDGRDEEFGIF